MQTLTVFTPAYNRAHTIGRTYKSLCSQKCKDFVWLIVDDGSTDLSAKIIDDYADLYRDVIKILHIKNSGVSVARMKGVLAAKGDWIGFTDGDDVIDLICMRDCLIMPKNIMLTYHIAVIRWSFLTVE